MCRSALKTIVIGGRAQQIFTQIKFQSTYWVSPLVDSLVTTAATTTKILLVTLIKHHDADDLDENVWELRQYFCFSQRPLIYVEESIVNAPLVRLQSKNTNNAKNEVRFK
jgi:hypothetical protein